MKRAYLAGPIQTDPAHALEWRENLVKELARVDWLGILPPDTIMHIEDLQKSVDELQGWIRGGHWDLFDKKMQMIEQQDITVLSNCDAIIVYLPSQEDFSWGTAMETAYAHYKLHIPIYLVHPSPISKGGLWLICVVRQGGLIFKSFNELIEHLTEKEN